MRLVKHHHALLLHLFGDNPGHLGIQQVLVAIHHHIGILDHLPREEVRAHPLLLAVLPEVLQRVHPRRQHDGVRPAGVRQRRVVLEEGAERDLARGALGGGGADPGGGEAAAGGVNGVAGGGGGEGGGVDAEVLAGGEAEGEGAVGGGGGVGG